MDRRARRRRRDAIDAFLLSVLGWVVVPAAGALLVFVGLRDIGPVWRATHGHGVRGSYVATKRVCDKACGYEGTFTAADGTVRYNKVWLDSPPRGFGVGDETEVFYAGGRAPRAVYREGSLEWVLVAGLLGVGVVTLAVWGAFVFYLLDPRARRADTG